MTKLSFGVIIELLVKLDIIIFRLIQRWGMRKVWCIWKSKWSGTQTCSKKGIMMVKVSATAKSLLPLILAMSACWHHLLQYIHQGQTQWWNGPISQENGWRTLAKGLSYSAPCRIIHNQPTWFLFCNSVGGMETVFDVDYGKRPRASTNMNALDPSMRFVYLLLNLTSKC